MRALVFLVLLPLVAGCSTMNPKALFTSKAAPTVSSALPDASDVDLSGRWIGSWTGTGIFNSAREDTVFVDLVQRGDAGFGRLVFEGTTAAESVPEDIRRQGLNGVRIFAFVSGSTVTLRHQHDGRLFTADMHYHGDRMLGWVRGSNKRVGLILTREGGSRPVEQYQAKAVVVPAPAPAPIMPAPEAKIEPAPEPKQDTVAMVPEAKTDEATAEPKPEESTRPRQEEYVAVPELKAVFFDFDRSGLRPDAVDTMTSNVEYLKLNEDTVVLIEGYCDERGTPEYNVALGDRRAKTVRDYLSAYGVSPERVSTVSYGKERPSCTEDTEACHNQNRRAEFRIKSR